MKTLIIIVKKDGNLSTIEEIGDKKLYGLVIDSVLSKLKEENYLKQRRILERIMEIR